MDPTLSGRLANIALPDPDGNPIRLGSLWQEVPAVVVFLRHYGWVFCREHVAQLREHQPAFQEKGAHLAAIGLGDRNYARFFREDTGITFPLLVDEQREAYRAVGLLSGNLLHLFRAENNHARKRARAAGHRQHRTGKNPFQLGGSFVFAPGNVDRFVHISQTFGDNATPEALLAAVAWGAQ